jgi:drug/metabolite transporter (DMT)-like permease
LTIGIISPGSASRLHLDSYGVVAALVASVSFAFYNIVGHRILARHDRWRVLVWTLAGASAVWLVINPPWKVAAAHYVLAQWGFLFVFSMISVLGALSFYFLGLQHIEPTRAIITGCLEPVFSILLTAILLGEGVSAMQTVGVILVLSAIVIVQLPGRGTKRDERIVVLDPIE